MAVANLADRDGSESCRSRRSDESPTEPVGLEIRADLVGHDPFAGSPRVARTQTLLKLCAALFPEHRERPPVEFDSPPRLCGLWWFHDWRSPSTITIGRRRNGRPPSRSMSGQCRPTSSDRRRPDIPCRRGGRSRPSLRGTTRIMTGLSLASFTDPRAGMTWRVAADRYHDTVAASSWLLPKEPSQSETY